MKLAPLLLVILGTAGAAFWAGAYHGGHRAADEFIELMADDASLPRSPDDEGLGRDLAVFGYRMVWGIGAREWDAAAKVVGVLGLALLAVGVVWGLGPRNSPPE